MGRAALAMNQKSRRYISVPPNITALYDGLNVPACWTERLAELFDVGVDGPVVTYEILAPDGVQDLVPGQDMLLVLYKIHQELIFSGRDVKALAVHADDTLEGLYHELVYYDAAVLYEKAPVALYKGIYLREKELGGERLGNVFVGADRITVDDVALGTECGQEDDRNIIGVPDESADFDAVFARHHDVQDYHVIAVLPDEAAGFDAVGGLIYFKTVIYKKSRSDVP